MIYLRDFPRSAGTWRSDGRCTLLPDAFAQADSRIRARFGDHAGSVAHAADPSFDVAVIKASSPDALGSIFGGLYHGRFKATNVNLRQLLAAAYAVSQPRVIGPGWFDNVRFDIAAKSPSCVPDTQSQPMLQTLLRDRFKLAAHLEPREVSVYHLTVARDGVKMPVYPTQEQAPNNPGAGQMLRGTLTAGQLAEKIPAS